MRRCYHGIKVSRLGAVRPGEDGVTYDDEPHLWGARMLRERAEEAARLLSGARGGEAVGALPASCRPQSDADAYQVQDAVTGELGGAVGGWEVGAASATTTASCAPIYAMMIRRSWTGMGFTKRVARIVADFGPFGRVEVAFSAAD